jgi:hypothetical protein
MQPKATRAERSVATRRSRVVGDGSRNGGWRSSRVLAGGGLKGRKAFAHFSGHCLKPPDPRPPESHRVRHDAFLLPRSSSPYRRGAQTSQGHREISTPLATAMTVPAHAAAAQRPFASVKLLSALRQPRRPATTSVRHRIHGAILLWRSVPDSLAGKRQVVCSITPTCNIYTEVMLIDFTERSASSY